jgi:hypothetical protein
MIDLKPILDKVQVPPNLKGIFDKAVLSGMRIMFDKQSHKMLLEQIEKPGPMPQKLGEGIVVLVYMLWTQSNKTLPPQIIVPLTVRLTVEAFDFLQKSGDPDATKEVLGEAMDVAVTGVMDRFGATQDKIPELVKQSQSGAAQQPQGGMLSQGA